MSSDGAVADVVEGRRWSPLPFFLAVAVFLVGACGSEQPDGVPPLIRSAAYPDWGSSDWIAFAFPDSGLWAIRPDGSGLRRLTSRVLERPDWAPDGKTLVANDARGSLWMISAGCDSEAKIGEGTHQWYPRFSPDGSEVAFSSPDSDALGPRGLRILDLRSHEVRFAFPYGLDPSWSSDGQGLVFTGWVYQSERWVGGALGSVVSVDTSGENPQMVHDCRDDNGVESASYATGYSRVVFREPAASGGGVGQVWVCNSDGSEARRLTTKGARWPSWSPDGSRLVYTKWSLGAPRQEGSGDLYIVNADGSGERRITYFNLNRE